MVQPHAAAGREQVLDTMIELTRLSSLQRADRRGKRQDRAVSCAKTTRFHPRSHTGDVADAASAALDRPDRGP